MSARCHYDFISLRCSRGVFYTKDVQKRAVKRYIRKLHPDVRSPLRRTADNLQHVAIIWVQVTQPRFLLLALPRVLAQTLGALAVLEQESEKVEGAGDGGKSDEPKGEGVTLDVLGASFAKKVKVAMVPAQLPNPIWKAVPTLCRKCPPTVEKEHQIMKSEEDIDVAHDWH